MTFDEFKADFLAFLNDSNVNLGRKTSNTRQAFMDKAAAKFDAIEADAELAEKTVEKPTKAPNPMSGSVMMIKPKDKNMALNVGKGVHAMTPGESARADEQLNRSPFTNKTGKKGK